MGGPGSGRKKEVLEFRDFLTTKRIKLGRIQQSKPINVTASVRGPRQHPETKPMAHQLNQQKSMVR